MSDSSWFFPKQQTVVNTDTPSTPTAPAPSTAPASEPGMRSLDDALLEIEQDMPLARSSEEETAPVASPSSHGQQGLSALHKRPRLDLLKHTLEDVKKNIQKAIDLINDEQAGHHQHGAPDHHLAQLVPGMEIDTTRHTYHPSHTPPHHHVPPHLHESVADENAIEGIFDGQGMVGPDGKQYAIPPNYASKSKLVEGDVLKLNISHNGSFIYKQVGPIARRRVVGVLETDPDTHTFVVKAEGQSWRVITASVTYFKGIVGDEVVILIPRDKPSKWAAVENIIKTF